jgi:hypothetical protein
MDKIIINPKDFTFEIDNIQEILILTDKGEYYKVQPNQFFLEKEQTEVDLCRLGISTFDRFLELFKEYEKAIKFSKKLTLDISCNYLHADEFIKILEYLEEKEYHQKITHFQVNHNRIEAKGISAILDFYFKCPQIEEINCAINYVGEAEFARLTGDWWSEEHHKKIHFSSY